MSDQRYRKWAQASLILALAFADEAISPEADAQSVPQLIYMTRKGLDVSANEIDRLINRFGFVCYRNPYNPRPCRIETALISFLRTLAPNRVAIAYELSALGAVCEHEHEQLNCVYRRDVESAAWITGSSTPKAVTDEVFRIGFSVSGADGLLHFEVKFDRTSKLRTPLNQ